MDDANIENLPTLDDRAPPTAPQQEEELQALRVREWNLPATKAGFEEWLRAAGVSLETFMTYPAAADMPASLRKSLGV